MAVSSYQMAVAQGRRSGQAGRVVPSGPAGNITYRFVPSGGGGGGRTVAAGGGVGSTALAALGRAKAQYQPGGGFGKGVEAGLERGRVKAVSAGMQNLVSAGLAGTTMAGGLGLRYEEEVAAPTRASLEGERARAISGIEMQEAGMGFQAGQAGLQRGFQAGESAASRSLQTYIAQLQASLQRESMAFRPRPTAQPVQQAQQFPSLYGEIEGSAPSLMGDTNGVDRYAGMTGNLISDVEWTDIQSQANRLR
ncbi:hypothetical protein LCGC14_0671430 [marine sediment metagenome]|uniref:Uncharacterized protein n=1 Tax=marine sediment metagenome TaxID=412755 RepID=A0A0F9TYV8_9ZZZZ